LFSIHVSGVRTAVDAAQDRLNQVRCVVGSEFLMYRFACLVWLKC
jgi:hypothetical protein